ncbi:flagellar filament capping protein FliD [Desulfobulbus rhabdoformis]|uniref:flagellar filament capping protein FliD n=1 Tax=Desulfobulbus rhabdoformis TaxID=34032 RepID=UPI001963CD03|nr:flagellar filament capping protein FliD [Desulfobulbus rhabdoformis]MBM9616341.1 flagellar filament capping protein FliD [Desulfobulbus rhabdoformis]
MTTISSTGTVSFSGLASGIDTDSIIESIIEVESAPKTLLEDKIEYLEAQQETYDDFNTLLDEFYNTALGLNSENDIKSFEVSNSGESYFSVSTSSLSSEGSYSVEVVSLAQQQKDVSTSYIEDTDSTSITGSFTLSDDDESTEDVVIEYEGTLEDVVSMINDGDYGLTAEIINDGSGDGYRLMLKADTAGEEIDIVSNVEGDIQIDTVTNGHTVDASNAEVKVDGVTYYSSSNTLTSAIKGATLTLNDISDGTTSKVSIESSAEDEIISKMEELVDAYNAIDEYVDTVYASDSTLGNSLKTVQRSLRNYLTSDALVNAGIETDWETGELTFDTDVFSEAYEADTEGMITSLFGDDDNEGIMTTLDDYLTELMSSSEGFLATKTDKIDEETERLEDSITAMETRLEKRQELLETQFAAMEELISSLNSTGDYLTSFFEDYNSSS